MRDDYRSEKFFLLKHINPSPDRGDRLHKLLRYGNTHSISNEKREILRKALIYLTKKFNDDTLL